MILVIDYGLCNIDSIVRALEECGGSVLVSTDPKDCGKAERMVLPGVGSFNEASTVLWEKGWAEAIRKEIAEYSIPLLGVCLGMQLLATNGTEGGNSPGLDIIPGQVVHLEPPDAQTPIPHVGWNEIHQNQKNPLFQDIENKKDFYFTHSYHFQAEKDEHILATTPYCGRFVSAVGNGRTFGVQFHPEKSLSIGLKLLRNFLAVR